MPGLILILSQFFFSCNGEKSPDKPNIVIILADDLGYGDLQCYNKKSKVPTPNLDQLAAEGMKFTDAYCPISVCSPTRYALMTGNYPFRSWKKTGVMANYEPSMIADEILTLPEMLQEAGYTTAGFGKWHLGTTFPTLDGEKPVGYGKFRADNNGANLDLSKPVSDGPLDHGFDHWLGFSCASECWIIKDKMVTGAIGHDLYTIEAAPNTDHLQTIPLEDYLPYITDHTFRFLKQQASTEQPFFLYYSPYVPHVPLAVSRQFRGSTEAGLYGDYVHELDHYVGKVLDLLDSLKMKENTIVLFASDNGSQFTVTSNELDLEKAVNNANLNLSKEQYPDSHHPNGILRGTKWTAWEGGVRTPLIIRWPDKIQKGSESDQLFALNDVIATLAAVIDFELPEHTANDSYNLLPVWQGSSQQIRPAVLVQNSGGLYGIRWDKWKYIDGKEEPSDPDGPAGQLYNLANDPSESKNIYADHPAIVEKMKNQMAEIQQENHSNL